MKVELEYHKLESNKKAKLRKNEAELTEIKLMRELKAAEAEVNALKTAEEDDDSEPEMRETGDPAEESRYKLDKYFHSQQVFPPEVPLDQMSVSQSVQGSNVTQEVHAQGSQ